jgi:hypothetical protein
MVTGVVGIQKLANMRPDSDRKPFDRQTYAQK